VFGSPPGPNPCGGFGTASATSPTSPWTVDITSVPKLRSATAIAASRQRGISLTEPGASGARRAGRYRSGQTPFGRRLPRQLRCRSGRGDLVTRLALSSSRRRSRRLWLSQKSRKATHRCVFASRSSRERGMLPPRRLPRQFGCDDVDRLDLRRLGIRRVIAVDSPPGMSIPDFRHREIAIRP